MISSLSMSCHASEATARTSRGRFVIGPPNAKQLDMLETYRQAQDSCQSTSLRPGVRNRELDAAAQAVLADAGYGDSYVSGHQPQHRPRLRGNAPSYHPSCGFTH